MSCWAVFVRPLGFFVSCASRDEDAPDPDIVVSRLGTAERSDVEGAAASSPSTSGDLADYLAIVHSVEELG